MIWSFFAADHFTKTLVVGDQYPIFDVCLGKDLVIRLPRASSKTEKTSWDRSRSQRATAGPVHSSTRKRIYTDSATSGMNAALDKDCDAKSRQA